MDEVDKVDKAEMIFAEPLFFPSSALRAPRFCLTPR